ncbi:peptidase dimerization domain-containing protein [Rhizobium mongolense]|uniref:Amidohydrolase n=1 Tax=Rhizobium mongolense TaxID=57676 RepID=A0ABR6IH16_9HYPH|nr:peptidase dimerization domain-containing protein [Rhizobium mongolense]MBB4227153.1 amidohydrolase [Rhizobium mongolense]
MGNRFQSVWVCGLFNDVDVAFTWHPWDENLAYNARMLATNQLYFTFRGTSAHAGFEPHLGRSALDAVELTNVGCNYLREHIIQDGRIHYAITDPGGRAPNVVQSHAQVLYKVRAPRMDQVRDITERVKDVARGAALMTGTELEITFDAASAGLVPNVTLARMMHQEFEKLGVARFSNSERDFDGSIQKTFSAEVHPRIAKHGKILSEDLNPFEEDPTFLHGSTDVGDVSWLVPTGQVYVATEAYGTPTHLADRHAGEVGLCPQGNATSRQGHGRFGRTGADRSGAGQRRESRASRATRRREICAADSCGCNAATFALTVTQGFTVLRPHRDISQASLAMKACNAAAMGVPTTARSRTVLM